MIGRQRRLVWQLYPSYLLLIVLVLLVVGWFVPDELRQFHYQRTADDLYARAQLIAPNLIGNLDPAAQAQISKLVQQYGKQSGTRITVILKGGRVLADSDEEAAQMDNHANRPEVIEAFSGRRGMSVRFSNTLGKSLMYVALPISQGEEITGLVRTALPVSDIDSTLRGILRQLLLGGLVLAILLAPLCWWLSRRLSRPLELMTAAAQRFSRGQLDVPLEIIGSEETGRLAEAMNRMAIELAERIEREIEQRGEIEAILGSMIEGIVAVDNDEQVIRLNPAAAGFFGVNPEQPAGRPIQELIRQAELQRFIRRALDLREPLEEELIVYAPNKRYLHVLATPLLGNANERIGVLVVLHDLTRLRQLESVRRDFVANVSHELKTPITAIRGAVETLLEDAGDEASERFLKIIFQQSGRLEALVEDLLELSRIEQGSESGHELEPTPLLPVVSSSAAACENLLAEQRIELRIDCPEGLQVLAHARLLEQAVINLLSNAIKYSNAGGQVNLVAAASGDRVSLRVEDFGCGIAKEHLPRLFERFYRVDRARSRKLGGTGLGLAIVKHVVNAHRGEIEVQSTPGKGSSFTILLHRAAQGIE